MMKKDAFELSTVIKNQERQSKLTLTENERQAAICFFMDREAEKAVLDAVNLHENGDMRSCGSAAAVFDRGINCGLRDDVAAPDADRSVILAFSADNDGAFVRVPKALDNGD